MEEFRIRHIKALSMRTLEMLSINARELRVLDISYSVEFQSAIASNMEKLRARVMEEFRKNGTEVRRDEMKILNSR